MQQYLHHSGSIQSPQNKHHQPTFKVILMYLPWQFISWTNLKCLLCQTKTAVNAFTRFDTK